MLPLELRLAAWLIGLAGIVGLGWAAVSHERAIGRAQCQAERDHERAAQAEVNAEAERQNRQAERLKAEYAGKARDALTTNLGKARDDADAARRALASLLDAAPTAASPAASDPGAAIRAAEAPLPWDVFGSCAKAITRLAEEADDIEARLIGWQAWWEAVKP